MSNSTHKVEVVRVSLEKHPNADSLSITRPHGGYCVVVRTSDWKEGALGAYIPPDSLVDVTRPEFKFLDSGKGRQVERIKVKRLRGIYSQGLLVPAPEGSQEGDDVAERLGVTHYEPPEPGTAKDRWATGGDTAKGPSGVFAPKYDVDSWRRFSHLLTPGEEVVVTEKIHGASAKYVWKDGALHCGSRTEWKKQYPDYSHLTLEKLVEQGCGEEKAKEILDRLHSRAKPENLWWRAISRYPQVVEWLRKHEGYVLYGEVYGQVQDLKYGTQPGEVRFAAFDVLSPDGIWLSWAPSLLMVADANIPWVPVSYVGPYNPSALEGMADWTSQVQGAAHVREGVVVKPITERFDDKLGRVILKVVGNAYLERA